MGYFARLTYEESFVPAEGLIVDFWQIHQMTFVDLR